MRILSSDHNCTINHSYRFKSLDAIRGIAALQVAVFHSGFSSILVPETAWLAVDLFFVLSGFVLAHRYFSIGNLDVREFITHRIARLYPLHILTFILLYSAYSYVGMRAVPDGTAFTVIQNVFLLNSVGFNPSGSAWNLPAWSISVEFWINILFVIFLINAKNLTNFIISTFLYVLILRHSGTLGTSVDNYLGFLNSGLVRGMSSFLLGIVIYEVFQKLPKPTFLLASVIEISVLLTTIMMFGLVDISTVKFGTFLFIPLFALIIISFAFDNGIVSFFIRKLRINYLGDISYSVYLLHTPILIIGPTLISILGISVSPSYQLSVYLFTLLLNSAIVYHLVERPSSKYLRKKLENEHFMYTSLVAMLGVSLLLSIGTLI